MKKKLNGYYNYTVILTYLGLLAGFCGIAFVINDHYRMGLLCLMLAGFCDMFDGAVAATRQRTDSEKKFGIQIDSLCDLICFGLFPALFTYTLCAKTIPALVVSFLYVLCALIRLAYFNVIEEERQAQEGGRRTSYQGLPVTTAALLIPLLYVISRLLPDGKSLFILIAVSLIALAFISPFRVKKPHTVGKTVMIAIAVAELALLLLNLGNAA